MCVTSSHQPSCAQEQRVNIKFRIKLEKKKCYQDSQPVTVMQHCHTDAHPHICIYEGREISKDDASQAGLLPHALDLLTFARKLHHCSDVGR
jgi:hypothetical protein